MSHPFFLKVSNACPLHKQRTHSFDHETIVLRDERSRGVATANRTGLRIRRLSACHRRVVHLHHALSAWSLLGSKHVVCSSARGATFDESGRPPRPGWRSRGADSRRHGSSSAVRSGVERERRLLRLRSPFVGARACCDRRFAKRPDQLAAAASGNTRRHRLRCHERECHRRTSGGESRQCLGRNFRSGTQRRPDGIVCVPRVERGWSCGRRVGRAITLRRCVESRNGPSMRGVISGQRRAERGRAAGGVDGAPPMPRNAHRGRLPGDD